MGRQRETNATYDGRRSKGEVYLETDHILFRGDFRLRIAFADVRELTVRDGTLVVGFGASQVAFELGTPEATIWVDKIRNPRSLLDKIGVKETDKVAIVGVEDVGFAASLYERLATPPHGAPKGGETLIFFEADSLGQLARIARLRESLAPTGALWVVSRKGKESKVKDTDVMAAAREAGLVDTKVVAFSPTHTALKLVIPRAARAAVRPAAQRRSSASRTR
jgi:Protein of unknown function (DUF3052)